MTLAHRLRRAGWRLGLDLQRTRDQGPGPLLRARGVDLVIDVGANGGEYGELLRRGGYLGAIHSLEPLPAAYERLAGRAAGDPSWSTERMAAGERNGTATLHVAGNNGHSSSLREMLPRHLEAAPEAAEVGRVQVPVARLDGLASEVVGRASRPFLKIDAQGYENAVLDGAAGLLDRLDGLQVELSLQPLYAGAPAAAELTERVEGLGMRLVDIDPGFRDPRSRELLQYDAIFVRA